MRINRYHIICLAFLLFAVDAFSFESDPHVKFKNYTIRDGLSHLGASCFYNDSKGFLWVGTFDGLNRFDGKNFKVFKHIPDDSKSLINNRIRCIFEHSSGKLLIGTERGICVYNSELEVFEELKFENIENVITVVRMFEDSNNRLWILTDRSFVYVIDFNTGFHKSLSYISNSSRKHVMFYDIVEDHSGYIWLASSNGLICYQKDFLNFSLEMPTYLASRILRTIEIDDKNNLWLSFSSTVHEFSLAYAGDSVEMIPKSEFKIESVVTSILSDSNGNLWMSSTNEGVFRITQKNNKRIIENYQNHPLFPESISSNWVIEMYEDDFNNIWFATAEKGIDKFSYSKGLFLNYDQGDGLKDDYVMDISHYSDEQILIGTRRGVSVYNIKTQQIENVWFDDAEFENKNIQVSQIHKDNSGYLWFGISGGIYFLSPGSQSKPTLLNYSENPLPLRYIESIAEDNFGNIWVGTVSGIIRLSFDERPVISDVLDFNSRADGIAHNASVFVLYNDPVDNSLWMGTLYNGLYHIIINGKEKNVNDFKIIHYAYKPGRPESLRSNFVSAILRTEDGDLWVGTEGGGLSRLKNNHMDSGFVHYAEKDGLSNNSIKSIIEGKKGKIYLGTNYKLDVFDPDNESFIYYDVQDGLKSDFFTKAALKLPNDEIAFGGNKGISVFDPADAELETPIPSPEFGDFLLSYKKVYPGQMLDGNEVLSKSLSHTDELKLKYFQNTFSIELLGIGFDKPEDSYYRYRLNNYDRDWIYTKPINNMAAYANVPPGEYHFEFNVSNDKNEWSDTTKQISIKVVPPFWKTGWAIGLYILVISGILVLVFIILLNIERLKSAVKLEQLDKEKEKEVNDIKLKFFTNVSHEFKTPVTLILGPVENLIREFKEGNRIRYNLLMIHEQANYLLRLVNQLLEFRKVEKESLKLKCLERDIVSFTRTIVKSFNSTAFEKSIQYDFHPSEDKIMVWFDPAKLEMIIYNLLSNAFKFTPKGGSVAIGIEMTETKVTIKVTDSGQGISKEELSMIFERFYQSKSAGNLHGTGIGLTLSKSLALLHHGDLIAESEPGEGAAFILVLPLGKEHLAIEEIMEGNPQILEEFVIEQDTDSPGHDTSEVPEELVEVTNESPTLLLIEDNFKLKAYLEGILREHYNVISTDNGNDGFTLACTKMPDLIVSDVMMPGMDGVQLLKKLKNETCTSHIPVILLTVKNEFDSYIKGLEIGADDYITKPFHVEHLLVRINNIIENRARLRIRYRRDYNDNSEDVKDSFSVKDNEFINTLYEIAEENLDNTAFSADSFSKSVFMSRTNFYKKLKALTDQTPGEFLRLYRIKRAKDLLSTGDYSVSQVTQLTGFKSRSNFYQCFKTIYGKLPTELIDKRK